MGIYGKPACAMMPQHATRSNRQNLRRLAILHYALEGGIVQYRKKWSLTFDGGPCRSIPDRVMCNKRHSFTHVADSRLNTHGALITARTKRSWIVDLIVKGGQPFPGTLKV